MPIETLKEQSKKYTMHLGMAIAIVASTIACTAESDTNEPSLIPMAEDDSDETNCVRTLIGEKIYYTTSAHDEPRLVIREATVLSPAHADFKVMTEEERSIESGGSSSNEELITFASTTNSYGSNRLGVVISDVSEEESRVLHTIIDPDNNLRQPTLSADGEKLAFSHDNGNIYQLLLPDLELLGDRTLPANLTEDILPDHIKSHPLYTEFGLLFLATLNDGTGRSSDIYLLGNNGVLQNITNDDRPQTYMSYDNETNRLVYVSGRGENAQIESIDFNNGSRSVLISRVNFDSVGIRDLSVFGACVVFSAQQDNDSGFNLFVYDNNTTEIMPLTGISTKSDDTDPYVVISEPDTDS